MNEPQISIVGNVAQDLRYVRTEQGVPITTFRLASTRRQFDRAAGRWVDGETTFVNVTCWRGLADHVHASLSKGDPVVVIGRLRVRPWERDGYKGNAVEIDAYTVGHDLTRGTSAFRRAQHRSTAVAPPEREVADSLLMSMEAGAQAEQQASAAASDGAAPGATAASAGTTGQQDRAGSTGQQDRAGSTGQQDRAGASSRSAGAESASAKPGFQQTEAA